MPIVKLTLSEQYYQKLSDMAQGEHKSMQDYIRDKIFGIDTIFTPEEAVRRIQNGDCDINPNSFTLPDVYGNEWTIERGPAGVFGKKFYNYIIDNPDLGIKFINMGKYGRRAVYKIVKKENTKYEQ